MLNMYRRYATVSLFLALKMQLRGKACFLTMHFLNQFNKKALRSFFHLIALVLILQQTHNETRFFKAFIALPKRGRSHIQRNKHIDKIATVLSPTLIYLIFRCHLLINFRRAAILV